MKKDKKGRGLTTILLFLFPRSSGGQLVLPPAEIGGTNYG